jgi:Na+-driven multidrug efflux pump
MNMTSGPILKKLIIYAIPLIITNMLQLLFNAADVAVLGILVNDNAVAAVGASGSLINLVTSMFIGLASGVQVVLSRRVGAEDVKGSHRLVGTALVTGLLGGLILVVIGVPFARQFLIWMNCAPSVLDGATIYLVIYFLGICFNARITLFDLCDTL